MKLSKHCMQFLFSIRTRTSTLPEHRSSPRFLCGSCCWIFIFLCSVLYFVICPFSFDNCVFRPSSIYGLWILFYPFIWYLQTLNIV